MLFRKSFIKSICLFTFLLSAVLTLYEICTTSDQTQDIFNEHGIHLNIKHVDVKYNREARASMKLRQYQRVAQYEINRQRFKKIITEFSNNSTRITNSADIEHFPSRQNFDNECKVLEKLDGQIPINNELLCDEAIHYLRTFHSDVEDGGHWRSNNCSRHALIIIIPYRDRQQHLCILLRYIIPMLKRQNIEFRIVVAEQAGNGTFNKGKLMNAAFIESTKLFSYQCVVFHDVDLIPEDDRNIYPCPWQPTHLSVAIDEMNYRLQYEMLVGGVLAMRKEHFETVNGFSNEFWGWGGEDDDMAYRIKLAGMRILRPPKNVARYKMLRHKKQVPAKWNSRIKLLSGVNKRFLLDGLNSANYSMEKLTRHKFYTHLLINVGKQPLKLEQTIG